MRKREIRLFNWNVAGNRKEAEGFRVDISSSIEL